MLVNSRIKKVLVYPSGATIFREFKVKLPEGFNVITIDNLEPSLKKDTIRIVASNKIKILGTIFETYSKPATQVLGKEKKKILEEIRKLEKEKTRLEKTVEGLEKALEGIDKNSPMAVVVSLLEEKKELDKLIESILEVREKLSNKALEYREKIEELEKEIKRLRSLLQEEGEMKKVGKLTIELEISEGSEEIIELSYNIPDAGWNPSYDLVVSQEDEIKLLLYAEIWQKTGFPWGNVEVVVSTKPIEKAVKPEPKPWYIRPIEKVRRVMAMPLTAAPVEEEAEAEEIVVTEEISEYLVYRLTRKVSIPSNNPRLLLLESRVFKGNMKYIWDAFTSLRPVEVIEFENKDFTIMGGKCRVYKENLLVGVIHLDRYAPGQNIEIPLTWADKLEVERKIVSRKEKKGGILKDRGETSLTYELNLVNHYKKEIDVTIYDRIPVSTHPEIRVELVDAKPKPNKIEMGILEWNLKTPPDSKKTITYTFKVTYPLEMEIPL